MIILLIIATVASYFFAPLSYSFPYCLASTVLFVIWYYLTFKYEEEKVGFNMLFSLAFFAVNYIYPLFVYPIFPTFSIFSYEINYNIITKATSMATMAYGFYSLGYIYQAKKRRSNIKTETGLKLLNGYQIRYIYICELLLLGIFIIAGGLSMFKDMYSDSGSSPSNPIKSFIYLIFYNFTLFTAIVAINSKKKKLLFLVTFIIVLLFFTGTRTLPIVLLSIIFCWVCNLYKLSYKKIFVLLLFGFIVLTIIGRFRGGRTGDYGVAGEELGLITSAEDFIVVTRNLYDIYDHVQKDGITYGVSSLGYILAVVPFAQSVVLNVFDLHVDELRSESMTSNWTLGEDRSVGLGTNIVGDVYLSFSLLGVIILFWYLGVLVRYSSYKAKQGSWKYYIVNYVLISGAIFMCRGSYFYSLKNIVWTLVFAYIFKRIGESRRKYLKYEEKNL